MSLAGLATTSRASPARGRTPPSRPESGNPSPASSPPPGGEPRVLHSAQVCTWTDSPDGRFIIDALAPSRGGGRVVVAAGCSGEGFKFSALMGTVLADLAEGRGGPGADEDVAALGLRRFEGLEGTLLREGGKAGRHVLGR